VKIDIYAGLRRKRNRGWHRWFAWHPISVGDGVIVWLETVERQLRGEYCPVWCYRLPEKAVQTDSDPPIDFFGR
jgi:hypothetical protein